MTPNKLLGLLLVSSLHLHSFADETSQTVVTNAEVRVTRAKGSQFTEQTRELATLVQARQLSEAETKAQANCRSFESIFDRSKKQYVFQSQEEFDDFKKSSNVNFEWIDWGYKECLQIQVFVAADKRDFSKALDLLKKVEAIAPMSAGASVETGYILNQLGKPAEGLSAYRRANELAIRYQSQRPYRAIALRGMGFSLIDLKQLDAAEKNFLESLEIEPGNKLAQSELAYIRGVRAGNTPNSNK